MPVCLACDATCHISCRCLDNRLWQSKVNTAACRDPFLMTPIMEDLTSWRRLLCLTAATMLLPLRMVAMAFCHCFLLHCCTFSRFQDSMTVHQCQMAGSGVLQYLPIIPSVRELPAGVAAAVCSVVSCTGLRPTSGSPSDVAFCPHFQASVAQTLLQQVA